MAKKRSVSVNKSKAIRDYYAANPQAKPREVAAALKKQGIIVSTAFVSTIRSTSKRKKTIGKPGRPPGSGKKAASQNGQQFSIESLLKVKKMVEEIGGIRETRLALSALEQLLD